MPFLKTTRSFPRPAEDLARLAALCARDGAGSDVARDAKDAAVLAEWARRHRVAGLAHGGLAEAGFPLLAEDARQVALDALYAAKACRELRDAFASRSIPLLFLKGLPIARLAYGNASLKMSADIDVLIQPEALAEAAKVLQGLGYAPALPGRFDQLSAWHRRSKESVWRRDGSPLVELHTALADNPALLASLHAFALPQQVEVFPGILLATLGREEQFAYLAVHGASSAWFRLKWLSDFAALLPSNEQAIDGLHRRNLELGTGRASGWALLLSHRLFGTALPDQLRAEFMLDPALRFLLRIAYQQLGEVREPTDRRFGTLGIHASQLLLQPGARFAAREGIRQVRTSLAQRRSG